jgi:ABC-type glutathione transport system ATPase component
MRTKPSAFKNDVVQQKPLLTFRARPAQKASEDAYSSPHHACPFGNETIDFALYPGGCLRLHGPSGLGKTSLAMYIANLVSAKTLREQLGICVEQCEWDPLLPMAQRCGVLFQQTTLLD